MNMSQWSALCRGRCEQREEEALGPPDPGDVKAAEVVFGAEISVERPDFAIITMRSSMAGLKVAKSHGSGGAMVEAKEDSDWLRRSGFMDANKYRSIIGKRTIRVQCFFL